MTSFAIYEFFGLLVAIPLSYLFAIILRKERPKTYKDELDKLFLAQWNGENEDEYYAWLRVRRYIKNSPANGKKLRYIEKKLREVNKQGLYSEVWISDKGEVVDTTDS